jgi:hypothetical protein
METIESLYPQIGQAVADAIPAVWNSARVEVELKPGVVSVKAHYLSADGGEVSFLPTRQAVELFKTLHARMLQEQKLDWKQARFELTHAGKFNLSFEY